MRYRGAWPTDRFRSLGPTNEPFVPSRLLTFSTTKLGPLLFVFLTNAAGGRAPILHAHPPWAKKNMFAPENSSPYLMRCNFFCFAPTWHRSAVVSVEAFVFSPSNVQMRRHLICILNRLNLKCLTKYASSLVT